VGWRWRIKHAHARPFPSSVGQKLLHHDGASELDHSEDHEEKYGRNQRKLNRGRASSV
jgi:hypothetical protein